MLPGFNRVVKKKALGVSPPRAKEGRKLRDGAGEHICKGVGRRIVGSGSTIA